MPRRPDALRGPTEPHLRLPRHRGEREQRQVPASLLHTGHAPGKLGVVYGQPTGWFNVQLTLPSGSLGNLRELLFSWFCLFWSRQPGGAPLVCRRWTGLMIVSVWLKCRTPPVGSKR